MVGWFDFRLLGQSGGWPIWGLSVMWADGRVGWEARSFGQTVASGGLTVGLLGGPMFGGQTFR